MKIEVEDVLPADRLEEAWILYTEVFEELRYTAVQRHLMFRSEFDGVMADRRIAKYLAVDDDGRLHGLSTYTNDLASMPLISPEYFERRWPTHFAERRVWYCGFVGVRPGSHSGGAFGGLVEAMYRVAEADGGIIGLDLCRHNDEAHQTSRAVRLMLHRLSGGVRAERMDEQAYWLYEFPAA